MVTWAKHDDPGNRIRIRRFRKFHRRSVYIGGYCTCRQHLRFRVCQHVRESSHSKHVYEISFEPANVSRGTQKILFLPAKIRPAHFWPRRQSFPTSSLLLFLSFSPRTLHFVAWPKFRIELDSNCHEIFSLRPSLSPPTVAATALYSLSSTNEGWNIRAVLIFSLKFCIRVYGTGTVLNYFLFPHAMGHVLNFKQWDFLPPWKRDDLIRVKKEEGKVEEGGKSEIK